MNYTDQRAQILSSADSHLATARHRFSLAALACMRGAVDASALVGAALHEVDLARAELRRLVDAAMDGEQPDTYRSLGRRGRK